MTCWEQTGFWPQEAILWVRGPQSLVTWQELLCQLNEQVIALLMAGEAQKKACSGSQEDLLHHPDDNEVTQIDKHPWDI